MNIYAETSEDQNMPNQNGILYNTISFGTFFMKELHSVESPFFMHGKLAEFGKSYYVEPHGLSFHVGNGGSGLATVNEIESN